MENPTTTQFVPANSGWLALFDHQVDGDMTVRAEPVIAWRLTSAGEGSNQHSTGEAVVGASPWVSKTDTENVQHMFAIVHEDQLEPEFLEELRSSAVRSREEILEEARRIRNDRSEGRATWMRDRRRHKEA